MTERATVLATYRTNEGELFQAQVTVASSFPDAVAEARSAAVHAIGDLLAEALHQRGAEVKD